MGLEGGKGKEKGSNYIIISKIKRNIILLFLKFFAVLLFRLSNLPLTEVEGRLVQGPLVDVSINWAISSWLVGSGWVEMA